VQRIQKPAAIWLLFSPSVAPSRGKTARPGFCRWRRPACQGKRPASAEYPQGPRRDNRIIAIDAFKKSGESGQRAPSGLFNCWTRKEAYVKARGGGLQIPLESFDVSLAPDEQAAFLSEGEFGWSLRALPLDPDYAAAIAVEGKDWQLRLWQWQISPGG
jgi:hypothetical protein